MIFHDQAGFVQIFAATSNGVSGNQTFGITSGTSNCGGGVGTASTTEYIESNKNTLANDISRGQGETLAALSQMLGCQDARVLGARLQKNYRSIFPTQNVEASKVDSSIKSVIKTSSLSCTAV